MKPASKPVTGAAFGILLVGALSVAQPSLAAAADAYLTDAEGQPVLSGGGGCVHTGSWKTSMPTCPEPTLVVEDDQAMIVFAVDDAEFFGFDKAELNDQIKADLDDVMAAVDNADLFHSITITGHADKIGPAPYNEQLALRRAQNVKTYLVKKGIPAERILAVSDSSSAPLVTCPSIKSENKLIRCLAPNRRVDIEAILADTVDIATITLASPDK